MWVAAVLLIRKGGLLLENEPGAVKAGGVLLFLTTLIASVGAYVSFSHAETQDVKIAEEWNVDMKIGSITLAGQNLLVPYSEDSCNSHRD